ncbi:M4 family metallopeptidase [Polyangium sp. 15x6]|uniref:M4 family metallopeptidase n=1 Tax=Polyangium sp. 15x6 TaxID=3042687 RepID=UPI00249A547B|nr:M4 family metallopeptidase [Polyangium sp. 15x6]MDI3284449.1 M4 family metallopeptidase [Polyangium sp. 15x6]
MRNRRLATLAPLTFLLAACAVDGQDVDNQAAPQDEGDLFVARDDQATKLAGDLSLEKIVAERPDVVRGAGDLEVRRVRINDEGEAINRLAQSIRGVPVFGGEAIVRLDRRGQLQTVRDYLHRNLKVETRPALAEIDARKAAYNAVDGVVSREIGTDLQIVPRPMLGAALTYRVQLEGTLNDGSPTMPVVFVDAQTGEIVDQYDNLQTGKSLQTYTLNNGTSFNSATLKLTTTGTTTTGSGDAVVTQAHENAGRTYDFYFNNFGRDSYTGTGSTIKSYAHYSTGYVNAYWDGTRMVYGDGDNVNSSALTVLDVVAHELTHAVTSSESNLTYSYESGALNEAMSDIFGAAVEAARDGAVSGNTWKIGEECWTPGTAGDALRYMNDPAIAGDYDYYPTRYTGSQDNGGVHWNSGIANLAFYLAVAGGVHPRGKTSNQVPALHADGLTSIQMGAAIFYRANTDCLGASSNFAAARTCTVDAATALYGAAAATSISEAWTAVGVGGSSGGGGGGTYTSLGEVTGISVGKSKWSTTYTQATPAGAATLKVEISGGTGDADLYVRQGSAPTASLYTCRPYLEGNNEVCEIAAPSGTYYIRLYGYAASSGITLKTSYK